MAVEPSPTKSRTSSSSRITATARTAGRWQARPFCPGAEIEPEKLRVTQGEDSLIRTGDPHGHSCEAMWKCFSLLYWTGYEGKIRVPYASLVVEPSLKPTAHMFVGSKAPWHEILDDLPQHDEYPWADEWPVAN